jgi:apolipoprotein N-acyltransferase
LQCANTGISAHINSRGELLEQTSWWKQEALNIPFILHDHKTFYALYGDYTGWLAAALAVVILVRGLWLRFRLD